MQTKQLQNTLLFLGLLVCAALPLQQLSAQSDDFVVDMYITDNTPPTVPTPFNATPITSAQINLSWGASTDDWILAGYRIWRDNTVIATTSNTNYADTGLAASTTYSYYVTAFDSVGNESASSTVVATSTYASPVTESSQGTRVLWFQNEPASISIIPNRDSAEIQYTTNDYTQAVIKWGKTSSYELGSLVESVFLREHETILADLEPDTKYFFTIEGFNRYSKYGEIYTGTFTTLPPIDTFPPHNVTNLTAVRSGDDIVLTWNIPVNDDFDKVRVVSNDSFYPDDIADGWVLYEGSGERTLDKNVPWEDSWKYYTVFTYDELGNISSGAVVRVYLGESVFSAPEEDLEEIDPEKNNIGLKFEDIIFIQDKEIITVENNWAVNVDGGKQLRIEVPYDKVPEHLKTILVVLTEKDDASQVFKFLLRINSEKTAYTGTIAPLGQSGVYPVGVSVFDFKTAQIGYAGGILISDILSSSQDDAVQTSLAIKIIRTLFGSHLLWGILALIALLYVSRRLLRAEW